MFVISIFVAILVTVIADPKLKIIQNHRIVPIKTNEYDMQDVIQVRIVGGKPAGVSQSQYQVGLFVTPFKGSENGLWCGGTLISEQYVLTASHCLVYPNNGNKTLYSATVYLGARNRFDEKEEGQERYDVTNENFIKHSDYDHEANLNDIALIKLPKPIKFNKYIKPARLPSRSTHTNEYLLGKTIVSSGWGGTNELKEMSEQLMFIKTKVESGNACRKTYSGLYNDDRLICINANGKSTCRGDSGGPHIYKENGVNYIVGVTAFGTKSCVKGAPQVLTRVSYYLDWIAKNTGLRV